MALSDRAGRLHGPLQRTAVHGIQGKAIQPLGQFPGLNLPRLIQVHPRLPTGDGLPHWITQGMPNQQEHGHPGSPLSRVKEHNTPVT
jgi:hypothetical protein